MFTGRRSSTLLATTTAALALTASAASAHYPDHLKLTEAAMTTVTDEGVNHYSGPALGFAFTLTAADFNDTVMLYATNDACLKSYQPIENAIGRGTVTEVFNEQLDSDLDFVRTGRHRWRVNTASAAVLAGQYTTLCAIVYDGPGDPRYPGHPHAIKPGHIWTRTQLAIDNAG